MPGLDDVLPASHKKHMTSDVLSRCSTLNHHHIAIIYSCKGGNVLATGTNRPEGKTSVHAEVDALQRLRCRLRDRVLNPRFLKRGVTVLSLRLSQTGELRLAKPCAACAHVLGNCKWVRRVEWSDQFGRIDSCSTCATQAAIDPSGC